MGQFGQLIDFRLTARRDAKAARAFLRQARHSVRWGPSPEVDGEMVQVLAQGRGRAPLVEAIRAGAHYALLTHRRSPVSERLVFAVAEASWVIQPSLALTRMRFRIWFPLNPKAVQELL